ncbi:hypothetical protein ACINK0_15230 [Deinococcus sp. VB343]|uniref:hypothetical protein n=1 Tax=Deinococcus sp. VB343 TaxID=3385567 RepID=UPI0039C9EA33
MSRTFHACPTCGQSTTNSGPCAACLEKQRNADRFHHTALGLGWLYLAWRARKPLFWFFLLGTAFSPANTPYSALKRTYISPFGFRSTPLVSVLTEGKVVVSSA